MAQSAVGNPYLFTGREYDAESGLFHYRARAYDPASGRFLQQDPYGYRDGTSLYEYGASNPATAVDPGGTALKVPEGVTYKPDGQGGEVAEGTGKPDADLKDAIEKAAAIAGLDAEFTHMGADGDRWVFLVTFKPKKGVCAHMTSALARKILEALAAREDMIEIKEPNTGPGSGGSKADPPSGSYPGGSVTTNQSELNEAGGWGGAWRLLHELAHLYVFWTTYDREMEKWSPDPSKTPEQNDADHTEAHKDAQDEGKKEMKKEFEKGGAADLENQMRRDVGVPEREGPGSPYNFGPPKKKKAPK